MDEFGLDNTVLMVIKKSKEYLYPSILLDQTGKFLTVALLPFTRSLSIPLFVSLALKLYFPPVYWLFFRFIYFAVRSGEELGPYRRSEWGACGRLRQDPSKTDSMSTHSSTAIGPRQGPSEPIGDHFRGEQPTPSPPRLLPPRRPDPDPARCRNRRWTPSWLHRGTRLFHRWWGWHVDGAPLGL